MSAVRLAGLEHVLHFTSLDGKIYMRSYRYVRVCACVLDCSTNPDETKSEYHCKCELDRLLY